MRVLLLLVLLVGVARAQSLPAPDSLLVEQLLLAEDRRDSTDLAFTAARTHAEARIRALAERAIGRIRDPLFAARHTLAPVAPSPVWPEPEWRLRFRALSARSPCEELRGALITDPSWPVRLRAADLAAPRCAHDAELVAALVTWIRALPPNTTQHARGEVSWHAAARAVEALALLHPATATVEAATLAAHAQPELRRAAARAAARTGDQPLLEALLRDRDPNVREAAVVGLAAVAGRAADALLLPVLNDPAAPVVRAAAVALRSTALPAAAPRAMAVWGRWVARQDASAHDARVALLALAGRPATDDRPPAPRVVAPPQLVALALGQDLRLEVTLAAQHGGGRFVVRLRGDVAPMMAARVLALVREGYYDGSTWHRAEYDFVLQGGSPGNNEYVGLRDFLRDELGTIAHPRGSIGMSTRGHDTGDAQWFINLRDNARLLRDYTVFAEIIEGMDVVDDILEGDVIASIRVLDAPVR
jgi:cyclophilin family peptidyl-prolyl cis-trans isomerase